MRYKHSKRDWPKVYKAKKSLPMVSTFLTLLYSWKQWLIATREQHTVYIKVSDTRNASSVVNTALQNPKVFPSLPNTYNSEKLRITKKSHLDTYFFSEISSRTSLQPSTEDLQLFHEIPSFFFCFGGSFRTSWTRIRIRIHWSQQNPDPQRWMESDILVSIPSRSWIDFEATRRQKISEV